MTWNLNHFFSENIYLKKKIAIINRYICNIIKYNKLIEHSSYIGTHMCCTNIMLLNMKTCKLQILKI